ncbi:hypothetical protein KSP35_06995 [Aquihabitans sp. G128]|uniref:hypothetical protein n=1 Tax=Aquihabitans sp. G128 TaxID=2849779 RepID=UPI001C2511EB|nr:hypothetical protein [Aquihabitans sp. G128]QXC62538.1 hypothetical protein KSP35_06995 [Aquihabitans sp. G128]
MVGIATGIVGFRIGARGLAIAAAIFAVVAIAVFIRFILLKRKEFRETLLDEIKRLGSDQATMNGSIQATEKNTAALIDGFTATLANLPNTLDQLQANMRSDTKDALERLQQVNSSKDEALRSDVAKVLEAQERAEAQRQTDLTSLRLGLGNLRADVAANGGGGGAAHDAKRSARPDWQSVSEPARVAHS